MLSAHDRPPVVALDDHIGSSDQALLSGILRSGRLPFVLSPDLQTSRSQLLGKSSAPTRFKPLNPIGYTVRESAPELHWQPLPGASAYQVKIFDSSYRLMEASPLLTTTAWRVTTPLPRNTLYSWQVTATINHQTVVAPQLPDPEARFFVLSEDDERALQQANQKFAGNHLLLAAKYAQHGLCPEALAEIQTLKLANPALPISLALSRARANLVR